MGAHQPVTAVAQHSVASHTPFIAHRQHVAPVAAHHAVAQVVATAAPFTAHQPVSAGLTSSLANVAHHAASPVTHHAAHIARPVTHASHAATHFVHPTIHASHIARPVVHGPIYRSGIALHGSPFTAFNKGASEDKEEEEESDEEEERSARVIEEAGEVLNDLTLEETSQNLIVNPEEEVTELEVEGRTFEEVSSTTTSATTTA